MNWQLTVTWICIGMALWFVARRVREWTRGDGSSSCGGCPKNTPQTEDRVISEDEITLPASH